MLTCAQITQAVNKYRNNQRYTVNDAILDRALKAVRTLEPSDGRSLLQVCVVADWGSIRLDGFPFHVRVAMASEINARWNVLKEFLDLHNDSWDDETTMLLDAVDKLSATDLLQPLAGEKRQSVFVSKYLHCCISKAFPIWDGNSLKALQQQYASKDWASYKIWIELVRGLLKRHRTCCLTQVCQPEEHLVRTMDKALFFIGQ